MGKEVKRKKANDIIGKQELSFSPKIVFRRFLKWAPLYLLLQARVEGYCDEIQPLNKTTPQALLLASKCPQL